MTWEIYDEINSFIPNLILVCVLLQKRKANEDGKFDFSYQKTTDTCLEWMMWGLGKGLLYITIPNACLTNLEKKPKHWEEQERQQLKSLNENIMHQ